MSLLLSAAERVRRVVEREVLIDELDLHVRARNPLHRAGVHDVSECLRRGAALLEIPDFGFRSFDLLADAIYVETGERITR